MRASRKSSHQLPKSDIRTSKLGYQFDVYADEWQLDNSFKINWTLTDELKLDVDFEVGFRKALAVYASEVSSRYTTNIFHYILKLIKLSKKGSIHVASLQNYLSMLDDKNEYKIGYFKAFLLDWYSKGYEGISKEVADFLEQLKLKGNVKGKAVSKGCPHSGAYSLQEQQSILEWAVNGFIDDKLELKEYAWLLANMYTGKRPVQLRALAKEDLIIQQSPAHVMHYELKVPKAKKRDLGFREGFEELDIDEDLALLLFNMSEVSVKQAEDWFGVSLSQELKEKMPIFLNKGVLNQFESVAEMSLKVAATPDILFMTSSQAMSLMADVSHKCGARTERLNGEFIHLTSRRFRYTVGTNAIRRGYGAYYVAEILGHESTQNVKVYTENTTKDVELIDEAMSGVLAPLAQAFAGTLIGSERDAIRANDPRSRIKSSDGAGVGNCGEYGFCASGGRQCYLCTKFQPWVHANHQTVLDDLSAERESLKRKGVSKFVIQSTDRLYMAITQVVQMCNNLKEKNKQGALIDG